MADFTSIYNTSLSPEEEKAFREWARRESIVRGKDLNRDLYDYDVRGFWKAGLGTDERGHGTDKFKKPNHPTFSRDSMYHLTRLPDGSQAVGGVWGENPSRYFATPTNLKHYGQDDLRRYFGSVEPDVQLVLPGTQPAAPESGLLQRLMQLRLGK